MTEAEEARPLPPVALLLSLGAMAIPVVSAFNGPDWMEGDVEVLIWLTALLPAFLLTFYKGWKGVSVALAGGMAILALTQVSLLLSGSPSPDWWLLGGVVVIWVSVTLGLGYFADLLSRERRRAESLALTDPLTGLPNRRHVEVFLDAAFSSAQRGASLSIVAFDLDHFKAVNDHHGHAAGDQVLRELGRVLRENTRRMDLSARFGGEEFLSILTHCGLEEAESFADRILVALRSTEFPWGTVTSSAGVAQFEEGMGSPEVLVAAADQALYRAKERGRDRVVVSTLPEIPPSTVRHLATLGPLVWEGVDPPHTPHVIVVDDDEAVAEAVGRLLEAMGFHVRVFPDPREALTVIQRATTPVDLLVVDVIMPGMSGLTLVEKIAAEREDLPVLYMSGYVSGEVTWKGVPGSATAFLEKPLSMVGLKKALRRLVGELPSSAETSTQEGPEPSIGSKAN